MSISPRLTLRQLSAFATIARLGSTTAAAHHLSLSQSAVSASLAELEETVAQRLFDRHGKRLHLNEYGRCLLPQALAVLGQVEDIELRGSAAGMSLHLAASSTIGNYVLPVLLADFRQRQKDPCQLEVEIGNTQDVLASLLRFEADLGLIEGTCAEYDLITEHWMDDDLVVVAGVDHPLVRHAPTLSALAAAEWLLREKGSGTREVVEREVVRPLGSVNVVLELGNSEAIKRTVMAGFGISCLSRHVIAAELAGGRLAVVETGLPPVSRPFNIVMHRSKGRTLGLDAFLSFLRQVPGRLAASAGS
jgi:DNA-binding transcriptional LysR family regulator